MRLENAINYVSYFIKDNGIDDEDIKQNLYLCVIEYYHKEKSSQISKYIIWDLVKRKYDEEMENKLNYINLFKSLEEMIIPYNINFELIELKILIAEFLKNIPETEANVLIMKFGLIDGFPLKTQEIINEYYKPHRNAYSKVIPNYILRKTLRRFKHPAMLRN